MVVCDDIITDDNARWRQYQRWHHSNHLLSFGFWTTRRKSASRHCVIATYKLQFKIITFKFWTSIRPTYTIVKWRITVFNIPPTYLRHSEPMNKQKVTSLTSVVSSYCVTASTWSLTFPGNWVPSSWLSTFTVFCITGAQSNSTNIQSHIQLITLKPADSL